MTCVRFVGRQNLEMKESKFCAYRGKKGWLHCTKASNIEMVKEPLNGLFCKNTGLRIFTLKEMLGLKVNSWF